MHSIEEGDRLLELQTIRLSEILGLSAEQLAGMQVAIRKRWPDDPAFLMKVAETVAMEHLCVHGFQGVSACDEMPCKKEGAALALMELVHYEAVRRHPAFEKQRQAWELQDNDEPTYLPEIGIQSYALQREVRHLKEKALETVQSQLLNLCGCSDSESLAFAPGLWPGATKQRVRDRRRKEDVRTLRGWNHPEPHEILRQRKM